MENHATHVISTERPRREWTRDERILRPNLIWRNSDIRWGSVDSIDGNNYTWNRVGMIIDVNKIHFSSPFSQFKKKIGNNVILY